MLELDHVVYFSNASSEENVKTFKHTVVGGQHKRWGTSNALKYTRNSYIEYLSINNRDHAEKSTHPLPMLLLHDLEHGEGWGTICFRTNNIDELNRRFLTDGWQTSGVIDAERETSTGFIRKWKMLFIDQRVSNELPFPFFIQWDEPFEIRMRRLREDGTITPENENLDLARCDFAVKDPEKIAKHWGELLNITPSENLIRLPNTELYFLKSTQINERLSHVHVENMG